MKNNILFLVLFISINNCFSQEINPDKIRLKPLDWEIMSCGSSEVGENESCTLYVKNKTNIPIQAYWLNYYNVLNKVNFGNLQPGQSKKWNLQIGEHWVFSDLHNNALGVFKTTDSINEIIISPSNLKNTVKITNPIRDRTLPGTISGGSILKEQQAYDVLEYDLKLEVFPKKRFINGRNIITSKVLNDLEYFVFDLDSLLTIENSFLIAKNKKIKLPVKTINGKHWCKLPQTIKKGEEFKISIEYSGNPRVATHAPYQGGFSWQKTANYQPWIATSCQIDGADLWIPCKDYQWDEPNAVKLSFTVPKGLKAISNGIQKKIIENNNGTTTFNWEVINPINNYNIALNIAPYIHIKDDYVTISKNKLDLGYWVLPQNIEIAKEFYPNSKNYIKFLEEHLGPYPFQNEKLHIVEVPFVGMEHQTIIAFGPVFKTKYSEYNSTLFHEICHEWFGNMITAIDWKGFWIQESFTGYMEALYEESLMGEKAYFDKIISYNKKIKNKTPLAPKTLLNSRESYAGDFYKKGAYLLHTLRYLIGKENVLKIIRLMSYPNKELESILDGSQCKFVTTSDFFNLVNKVSEQDLSWFENIYFRNAPLPELLIQENKKGVLLEWVTKDKMPFPMPLEIETKKGVSMINFKNNKAQLDLTINDIVEIDPKKWILFTIID